MITTKAINIDDAARQLLLHPDTVRRYVREGCPHTTEDGRLMLVPCDVERWMIRHGRYGMPGRPVDRRAAERLAALRALDVLVKAYNPSFPTIH